LLLIACSSTKPVAFPYDEFVETNGKFRDDLRRRDIPIHTYAPIGAKPPFPIAIVSQDRGQDLGRALARAGFYTVHLTHVAIDNPENRALDVSFVLDRLAEDNLLDINRVALVGRVAQRDKRVKAIVTKKGNVLRTAAFLRAAIFE
jgi:hypothetical protein